MIPDEIGADVNPKTRPVGTFIAPFSSILKLEVEHSIGRDDSRHSKRMMLIVSEVQVRRKFQM